MNCGFTCVVRVAYMCGSDTDRCVVSHIWERNGELVANVQHDDNTKREVPASILRRIFQFRVELDVVQRVLHVRDLITPNFQAELPMNRMKSHFNFVQECLKANRAANTKDEATLSRFSASLPNQQARGALNQVFFNGLRASGLLQEHLNKLTEWFDSMSSNQPGRRMMMRQLSGHVDDDDTKITAKLVLKGVGISIMNHTNPEKGYEKLPVSQRPSSTKELLYVSLSDIHVDLDVHESRKMCVELKVYSIQIDNQTSSLFPVVMSREAKSFKLFRKNNKPDQLPPPPASPADAAVASPTSPSSPEVTAEEDRKPMLFLGLCQLPVDHDRATMIESLNILLQGIDVNIDTEFLNSVLRFLVILDSHLTREKPQAVQLENMRRWVVLRNNISEIQNSNHQLIFKVLNIQPMKVNVTFQTVGDALQKDNFVSKQLGLLRQLINFFLTFSDVEATLKIKGYATEAVFCTPETLATLLQNHYVSVFAFEAYKVMGGMKLFGNPTKLIHNVGTGVVSLFYEPAKGAMDSPKEFAKGFASGGYEFVAGVSTGVLGTVSSLVDSAGGFLSKVTLDDDYQHSRKAALQPKNVGAGALSAGKQMGMGLFKGVTGLVTRPIARVKEGQKHGAGKAVGGFFRGMWEGVTGVVIKPVLGVTDGVRDLVDGAAQSIRKEEQVPRSRLPRLVLGFPIPIVCDFNPREAQAQRWLKNLREAVPNFGHYVFHAEVDSKDQFLLLTDQRVLHFYCRLKEDRNYGSRDKVEIFMNVPWSDFWGSEGMSCVSEKVSITSTTAKQTAYIVCQDAVGAHCLVAAYHRLMRLPPFTARDYHHLRLFMLNKEQSIEASGGSNAEKSVEEGKVAVTGAVVVQHEIHTERKFMGRQKTYVRFRIEVTGRLQNRHLKWIVERRYSEFQALRKILSKKGIWPEQLYKKHLSGSGWADGKSSDAVETRKRAFTLILEELKPNMADTDIVQFLCHDSRMETNAGART